MFRREVIHANVRWLIASNQRWEEIGGAGTEVMGKRQKHEDHLKTQALRQRNSYTFAQKYVTHKVLYRK